MNISEHTTQCRRIRNALHPQHSLNKRVVLVACNVAQTPETQQQMQHQLQKQLLRAIDLAALTPMKHISQAVNHIQAAEQFLQHHDTSKRSKLMTLKLECGTGMGFTIRVRSTKLHSSAFLLRCSFSTSAAL
jgi:hypothetical protein